MRQNVSMKSFREHKVYMQAGVSYVGQAYLTHCVVPRGEASAPSLLDELVATSCTARPRAWAVALDITARYTAKSPALVREHPPHKVPGCLQI